MTNGGPSGGVLKSFACGYTDPAGRDTELAQTVVDGAGNRTINTYDPLGRLVEG